MITASFSSRAKNKRDDAFTSPRDQLKKPCKLVNFRGSDTDLSEKRRMVITSTQPLPHIRLLYSSCDSILKAMLADQTFNDHNIFHWNIPYPETCGEKIRVDILLTPDACRMKQQFIS